MQLTSRYVIKPGLTGLIWTAFPLYVVNTNSTDVRRLLNIFPRSFNFDRLTPESKLVGLLMIVNLFRWEFIENFFKTFFSQPTIFEVDKYVSKGQKKNF